MSELKSPRRALGVMTLVMACLFAAGWIRSSTTVDCLFLDSSLLGSHWINSKSGEITWIRANQRIMGWPVFQNSRTGIKYSAGANNVPIGDQSEPQWFRQIAGEMAVAPNRFVNMKGLGIAHQVIVLPLTLISVWLLFSKPGKWKLSAVVGIKSQ
ncbi:hypothetical protein [Schlesneria paludicola]|uniref:hypothetical protein n=1 Tax=Schlesneria paludicola TaxID=360056 RepID=UPI00029B4ABA|nr:hypothetical protein [Schlesneria paludicola]